ncbi:MAG TPA: amidohydrolase family protein [Spongiibacteraceae bacterium]|nr:amidohydrolase family protein [Spongiibacteraceae bacterium]
MDIVDAQVHLSRDSVGATLESMDALGINGLVIDECWYTLNGTDPTHFDPGFELSNGAWRAIYPTALLAATLHPDRFCYLVRVDRNDPDLDALLRILRSEPGARAIRIQPAWTMAEAQAFASGAYDELFALAEKYALPVFVFIPGFVELLPRYLAKFPRVKVIVDHCGMAFPSIPYDRPEADRQRVENLSYFDEVLKLAEFPNVALKWGHAQRGFNAHEYPYAGILPFLRKAITAFGADRLMWASDNSVIPEQTWADLLGYVRDCAELTREEKEWILGRSARQWLNWPAANK